jgi:hypothetical protein
MDHPWEVGAPLDFHSFCVLRYFQNDTGRIVSKKIQAYLSISGPWLSKARKVIKLVDLYGPESQRPDPLVVARLSSKASTNKGDDILKFLCDREAAIKAGRKGT